MAAKLVTTPTSGTENIGRYASQENRLLELLNPLGKDKLLIRSLAGDEALSQLFHDQVEVGAPGSETLDFLKLLGWPVTSNIRLFAALPTRFFHGLVNSVSRGARGNDSTAYTLHLVPALWILSRSTQSRIFQQQSVPDILKTMFDGLSVTRELQAPYPLRAFCVQIMRISSRLRLPPHGGRRHLLLLPALRFRLYPRSPRQPRHPQRSPRRPRSLLRPRHEPRGRGPNRLLLGKATDPPLRQTTLWDHNQLPCKNLKAQDLISQSLQIGQTRHPLAAAGNDTWERYDYPGGYSLRFDRVSSSGGEQSSELHKTFDDSHRTAHIRRKPSAPSPPAPTPACSASPPPPVSNSTATMRTTTSSPSPASTSPSPQAANPRNRTPASPPSPPSTASPSPSPSCPSGSTPRPVISGAQSAVVAGPPGDQIHTDKDGRIKRQFPWDRAQAFGSQSSCWVRCAMPWAGQAFGFLSIPLLYPLRLAFFGRDLRIVH